MERRAIRVSGVVQGVGFRPFVHHLASELGVAGLVGNDDAGVFVEAEGAASTLDELQRRLAADAPRLAVVISVVARPAAPTGERGFRIVPSARGDGARTAVPPDVAMCDACRREVDDPGDRRHRYPFANCTDCGPRLTIIRDLPYDRPATTMAAFTMCPACRAEYDDPADRRYHAQPIACPVCGPQLTFTQGDEVVRGTDASIAAFHRAVAAGAVVAVKGVGGFHLACDATDDAAVALLRRRKGRAGKPFALMVADLSTARELAVVSDLEARALSSAAAPILLLRRLPTAAIAPSVAPSHPLLGVMLPYSPLHHLLFRPVPSARAAPATPPRALVLTSCNLSDEPIAFADDDERIGLLADAVLGHDRPIHVPCDDSVVRVVGGEVQPVRRSRGFAPLPVALPVDVAPTLAVGGELKNTFCVATGRRAWVSQHVGDMGSLPTLQAFERGVEGFTRMYRVPPAVVAADAHPGYSTRRWAATHSSGADLVEVQHHHAHVAALMAEHGLDEPVIGVAFDGTGYGTDAEGRPQLWGGEVLLADYHGFRRLAHLRALPLPGGDEAVRNPCRVAVVYLAALGIPADDLPPTLACDPLEAQVVRRQAVGAVTTTSVGRLFDAVASLLDVCHRITYEAQAAIELEALAETAAAPLPLQFAYADGVLDPTPVLRGLIGADPAAGALGFHHALADAVATMVADAQARVGPRPVGLTGGVFQNALLTGLVRERLGADVLTHRLVPANDGGLSLGQAVVAGVARRAAAGGVAPAGKDG